MKFQSELLIFILLLVTNLRVFFVQHVRRDPLVILAPFTFLLSILQILAWSIDLFTLFAFVLSLLVLFSNFHAIFRYSEQLFVDHYSSLMKVWAVLTVFLSIFAITVLLIFAPMESKSNKIGVNEKLHRLSGTFRTGFSEAVSIKVADAFIYEFSKADKLSDEEKSPIIIFFPDKRSDSINYKPYFQQLALKGYKVYSGDFYSKDCRYLHSFADNKILRRTFMLIKDFSNKLQFASQREFYSYNIKMEAEAMMKFVSEKEETAENSKDKGDDERTFILICDAMGHSALEELKEEYPTKIEKIIFIDDFPCYETKGLGLITQTEPLTATFLGYQRSRSKDTLNLLTESTLEKIKNDTE